MGHLTGALGWADHGPLSRPLPPRKNYLFPQPVKGARAGSLSFAGLAKAGENRGKPGKTGGIFGAL